MKLGIVIGSVREGRVTDRIAKWVEHEAKNIDGVETKLIDLKDIPMALFNEPSSPQYTPDRHPEKNVQTWLDLVDGCDALALVTPEYNRSYAPALKNALDYLAFQLKRKPVMLVAHGSTGGAQAVAHLRGVLPGLLSITTPQAVMFVGRAGEAIDEKGETSQEFKDMEYGPQTSLKNALDDLKWYSDALAEARSKE